MIRAILIPVMIASFLTAIFLCMLIFFGALDGLGVIASSLVGFFTAIVSLVIGFLLTEKFCRRGM